MSDQNLEIARLQDQIAEQLTLESSRLIFDFKESQAGVSLNLFTVNPRHDQSFLYHTVNADDKVACLKKMLEYVQVHFKTENNYTIQWIKIGENKLQTSYFSATNIMKALSKFFYDKNAEEYKVFSVTLNPVS